VGVDPVIVSTDIHLLRQCALSGLGIALVPDAMLPEAGGGKLVPVLEDVVGRQRVIQATVPRMLADVPKIRAVMDHTRQRWSREPRAAGAR
jgi:DNA-binding transcriptional LysR family regulator